MLVLKECFIFPSKTKRICNVPFTSTIKMVWLLTQDEPVEETLASLLKRSKSHPFYGLMGKRSGKTSDLLLLALGLNVLLKLY